MIQQSAQSFRQEVARELQEKLGQHLLGTLLSAKALIVLLERRRAPEVEQARQLLEELHAAAADVKSMIRKLDLGHGR